MGRDAHWFPGGGRRQSLLKSLGVGIVTNENMERSFQTGFMNLLAGYPSEFERPGGFADAKPEGYLQTMT